MRKLIVIFACCAGFYYLLFQGFRAVTDVGALEKSYPHVIYSAKTKERRIEIRPGRPAQWANLGAVSPLAVAAIVLSEDWAFYQHNGFDWDQIWDAFQTNLKKGKFARGGSTITQQVVKNVFLGNQKTILRKLQEAVLAIRTERQLTKKKILEIYLNIAEFGEGTYGIGAASRLYFGKAPSELSAKEGAFLAMLLPSPKKYSVSFRKKTLTPYANSTVKSILGKLLATHRLTEEEYRAALATPLPFEAVRSPEPVGTPDDEEVIDAFSGGDGEGVELPASQGLAADTPAEAGGDGAGSPGAEAGEGASPSE